MSRGFEDLQVDIPWSRIARLLPLLAIGLAAAFVLWKGFYTVAAHEQAVLMRFGKLHSVHGPGLHFMIPLVDTAIKVETDEKSVSLPYGLIATSRGPEMDMVRASRSEPLILTGDLYAGVVEWNVVWRIVDPGLFVVSIAEQDVESTIQAVSRSAMNRVVGDYSADEILTGKREEVGLAAHDEMQDTLDSYESGIRIVAVQMQRVTPPERVKPAFDAVNESIQQRDQSVNEARRERNQLIPQAEATRDRLIRESEGYAARRRAEAQGEITALLAKFEEYKLAPDVTRNRLYLDAMEKVIANSGSKTVLDSDLKNLLPLLNLGADESPAASPTRGTTR